MSGTKSRTLYGVITLLVALVILASSLAGLYYYQYNQELSVNSTYIQQLKNANVYYYSNMLIDYGNGTRTWFNNTKLQPGTNVYIETQILSNGLVNATWYPQYSSHFVTAIFNLGDTKTMNWLLWTYNKTASWQMAQVGPDGLQATNGSIFAWSYCGSNCTAP
ncbi:MAG: hypothetical protein OK457_11365 [Thaumarchaeota archaeon]|nr:hypothetical protein [Nitrososphaerota archaeon]